MLHMSPLQQSSCLQLSEWASFWLEYTFGSRDVVRGRWKPLILSVSIFENGRQEEHLIPKRTIRHPNEAWQSCPSLWLSLAVLLSRAFPNLTEVGTHVVQRSIYPKRSVYAAIKGGRSDKSSLRSLASSFKSTRSYEQDENDLPFFERLRMLRRAGEMPARKSLIFDEATAGQIRELTAREMPLPQKERKRRKNSKSSGKVPMVPSIREVVHENVENHGEPPIHDDNPLSEPKPPVAPITDA